MINDRAIAEDLTQETFIKAWKSLSRFDATKTFKPWLFSIARNTAIDYVRKKQPFSFSSLEDEEDQAREPKRCVSEIMNTPERKLDQSAGRAQQDRVSDVVLQQEVWILHELFEHSAPVYGPKN